MDDYPDHAYAEDARELMAALKLATFKKDTIGCLLPLSGKYKIFGQRTLKGIQLAVQELSKIHGKNFNVIIKDTQSSPERALECVGELGKEKVMGIVGPLLTMDSAGKRAEELGIPMIALTQNDKFPLQGDYLFSNFITPQMQVQSLASYIFMELGIKKVAILYPNERYGKRYMELFWDVVDEFNGEVVGVESYDGKKTDFTTPIKKLTGEYYPLPYFLKPKIPEDSTEPDFNESRDGDLEEPEVKNSETLTEDNTLQGHTAREKAISVEEKIQLDFQALFIPDSPSRVNLILPQLAFYDAKGMVLLGTNLWHQKSLLTGAKGYNKNAVITDGYFGDSKNAVTQGFGKRFKELFEESPGFLEAIAYDTTSILFSAAMDDKVDSRESLKDALQGTRMFEGVTGKTIFDKNGNAHKELFLITVKRGKFMEISH
jgi:branched-chain amino acid transport system substrate-binding protein